MTTGPEETGSDEAAEAPTLDGYGNDTGFAEEAAEDDEEGTDPPQ